jgi:hypothetical protein
MIQKHFKIYAYYMRSLAPLTAVQIYSRRHLDISIACKGIIVQGHLVMKSSVQALPANLIQVYWMQLPSRGREKALIVNRYKKLPLHGKRARVVQ